jgi:BirA family biotin operon repressor/biotin-[acetyl-CoA-carboxylase] ligase
MSPVAPLAFDWRCAELQARLASLWPDVQVRVQAQCTSTNSLLLEQGSAAGAASAEPGACLLVAEHQTQGRGRQGRAWHSAAGHSLTFSLGVRLPRRDLSGLSLAVGVALAEAFEPAGRSLLVKWPNDLWVVDARLGDTVRGRKLGGVLIECTPAGGTAIWVVIGVGLNIEAVPVGAGASGETLPATAGLREIDPLLTPPAALHIAAPAVLAAAALFAREGFAPFRERFARRDLLQGVVVNGDNDLAGTALGIDADGALRLRTLRGIERVLSGEVRLRPRACAAGA